MHHFKIIFILIFTSINHLAPAEEFDKKTIYLCYGKVAPESINGYDYVILEAQHYSKTDIAVLKKNNTTIFAYISLGEVNEYTTYFKEVKNNLVGKNKIWDSYFIDLSAKETRKVLMKHVKSLATLGFDGLFLDNIDNFCRYGKSYFQKDHLISLIKEIKDKNDHLKLIQNSGLELLPNTHAYISSIVIESLVTDYDFKTSSYAIREKSDFKSRKKTIQEAYEKYKKEVIIIEYSDSRKINRKIKRRLPRKWSKFIGNINLQTSPSFR